MVMFASHVRESVSTLSEGLVAVKTLKGSKFEMHTLDVELDVREMKFTVRTRARCLVPCVVFTRSSLERVVR